MPHGPATSKSPGVFVKHQISKFHLRPAEPESVPVTLAYLGVEITAAVGSEPPACIRI